MKNILIIIGTRPEAIKMALPIIEFKKLSRQFQNLKVEVCVTGQHQEMLDQVLEIFEIVPDYNLKVMQKNQDLTDITIRVLEGLKLLFTKTTPDLILVHGDTTTTFASSLAAFYKKIPVGHVEAGLRTWNKYSPWPEEINRQLTSSLTTLHFAPTESARINLISSGVDVNQIFVSGNTVVDALQYTIEKITNNSAVHTKLKEKFSFIEEKKKLILVTGHRRENFGENFEQIFSALIKISEREDVEIIYPVHLNPNVREAALRILGKSKNIHLIDPLDYLSFVYLLNKSYFIVTDSGGIQEEAPSLGKPVLVTREITERPEAVEAGIAKLVGASAKEIIFNSCLLLDDQSTYLKMSQVQNPYGNGKASEYIAQTCTQHLGIACGT